MEIRKEEDQVFIGYKEPTILKTVNTSKLKGNPHQDTEKGIVRIYKSGYYEDGVSICIQLRKVIGKYTYLNSFNISASQLKKAIEHLEN